MKHPAVAGIVKGTLAFLNLRYQGKITLKSQEQSWVLRCLECGY